MTRFTAIAVAVALLGSSAAFAQYNGNDRNRGYQQQQGQYDNRNGNRNDRFDNQDRNAYQDNGVNDRPHWSRGDRLPRDYRGRQYEVSDWRNRNLRRPPRGYHWVEADNRYMLAAITSGLIADIILNDGRRRR